MIDIHPGNRAGGILVDFIEHEDLKQRDLKYAPL